jgi:hypothetical protein
VTHTHAEAREFSRRLQDFLAAPRKWLGAAGSGSAPHEYHTRMVYRAAVVGLIQATGSASLQDKILRQTVQQLGLGLRLQLVDAHECAMLESLLHLVEVNELEFTALIIKCDHLYPEQMRRLDWHLRARITSLLDA